MNHIKTTSYIILGILIMAGCAAPPHLANMIVPIDSSLFSSTGKSLRVEAVIGGEVAGGHEMFRQALAQSLRNSNLFKEVINEGSADYKLKTVIVQQKLRERVSGYEPKTIDLSVYYYLYNDSTSELIFERLQAAPYTGKGRETKPRIMEGAVRENIAYFINELSRVEL